MLKGGKLNFLPGQLCIMKKILVLSLLFAACKSDSGIDVNHTVGRYASADDTLIIRDTIVINRTGYQKIRNGKLLQRQYQVKQWSLHRLDAPLIRFDDKNAFLNQTIYTKLP
jgi:hypothetical protein